MFRSNLNTRPIPNHRRPRSGRYHVDEGQPILCGGVRVLNAHHIDVDRLTESLTKPYLPRDAVPTFAFVDGSVVTQWVDEDGDPVKLKKPIWDSEQGVPFDRDAALMAVVKKALAEIGFSNTLVVVSVDVDETLRRGTLVIDVIEEGQHDRAASIVLTGLKTNNRSQVLAFLDIAQDDEIDREKSRDISRLLWESGRFEKQSVTFDEKTQSLNIDFVELSGVPGLGEALNENAEVLRKASRWLSGITARGDDCEWKWSLNGKEVRAIFSDRGMYLEITTSDSEDSNDYMSILLDHEQLLVNHSELDKMLRVRLHDDVQITFSDRSFASPKPDKFLSGHFKFGGKIPRKKGSSIVEFNFLSSPSDWVPLAYKDNVAFEWSGTELVVEHKLGQLRIDVETGQVNQLKTEHGEIRFTPGLFTAARDAMSREFSAKPSADESDDPLSSLASYVLADPVIRSFLQAFDQPEELPDPNLLSAMRKLTSSGLFSVADVIRGWAIHFDDTEGFDIPIDIEPRKKSDERVTIEMVARIALQQSHQFFEEGTWPSTLTREAALVVLGETKHTSKVLRRLVNDEQTGPIGLTVTAFLMQSGGIPKESVHAISQVALRRLNPDAFAADVEFLTRIIPIDYITRLRKSFQSLTPAELDAVTNMLDNENGKLALQRIHAVGKLDREDLSEAHFWYLVLHGPLESWLKR